MPTIKVILNPVSGRGAGQRTAEVIRHTLTEAKATFEIVETTEQRSAIAQAAQAVLEGWDIIAAVGGDGSANEVLNGIFEASLGTFRLLPYFIRGTHAAQPTVMVDRTAHIVVASEQGLPVHVDGEIMRTDAHRLEVSALPRRLRVVC